MTAKANNPYRDSLAGLEIADPVNAFFDFCKERDSIRRKREAGEPPPWTQDVIFQRGRFLNVFREDDKGTKAVLRFAEPAKGSLTKLIHALFFARWCNHDVTLLALDPAILKKPGHLRHALLHEVQQPWSSEVYPVVSAQWNGRAYDRLNACVDMFPQCTPFLEECIRGARGNVMKANGAINAEFRMSNDFPLFMALVDLALFRPDLMDPNSPVPTGIGAAPYLDLLQKHLHCANHQETAIQMIERQDIDWPDARRKFTPIDIEYLSCECRKYFSYVNGTKKFEGRNMFVPSETGHITKNQQSGSTPPSEAAPSAPSDAR
ncbi:MAG: putative DNA base hypermodification protein [Kiritimatiellae bacterium]|nr:putative DNA base hypermodification protein [Kiritimatiellia bacterium]